MSNGRKWGKRRGGVSVEKWSFWMSNGWIWGMHPVWREHKLQSQFIIAELLLLWEEPFHVVSVTIHRIFASLLTLNKHNLLLAALPPPPFFYLTQTILVSRPRGEHPVCLDVAKEDKREEGRKNIGKVTSIKILMIECMAPAWQTQLAGLCCWLNWFLVLYYVVLLTLMAFRMSLPAAVSSSFLLTVKYIFLSSNQTMVYMSEIKRFCHLESFI